MYIMRINDGLSWEPTFIVVHLLTLNFHIINV